jgi:hypothetical protein
MRAWDADILHLALEEEETTDLDDDDDAATAECGEDLLFGCSQRYARTRADRS